MATSDNVTNENSNGFSDGTYDPDIEARLYAEIYYSNETYADDHESTPQNDLAGIVDTTASSSSPRQTNIIRTNSTLQNEENHLSIDNSIPFEFTKPRYTAKNWQSGRNPHVLDNRRNASTPFPKTRRLLALKDLWLPPRTEERRVTPQESLDVTVENNEPSIAERTVTKPSSTVVPLKNRGKDFLTIVRPNDFNISADRASLLEEVGRAKAKRRTEKREARRQRKILKVKKRKSVCITTKAFGGTANLRRCEDAVNSMGITTETSKYKVISKKKKQTMKEAIEEAVEISSDSDTSILEVPIPPKTPPPVIQLQDSDDEHDRTSDAETETTKISSISQNKETTPCISIDSNSSESDDSPARPRRQNSPPKPSEIHDEATNDVVSSVLHCEENTLILNCTDIQRGAATLEDIRKHREMGLPGHALSDDSMTESEANNWVNIAAGQADSRNVEMGSIEQHQKSLWDQLIQGGPIITENTSEKSQISGTRNTERTFLNVENRVNYPVDNVDSTTSTRKRSKDTETRVFGEFNVPEVPEKRKKRASAKTRRDDSLNDYFFKPMTKEMQAFYNNPWGGENLNVVDIQSKMPKHPRHWMILDADLRGPTSRRRSRPCPRCRSDSHYGKKCPEKPKAPSCSMCGEMGHTETRCPGTMCLTCGSKYTTYRQTCSYCCQLFCNMCQGTGHTNENCPDLWRKYHNTTTETMPVAPLNPAKIMKLPQHLSCCNCGKRGHEMTTCRQLQWSQHFTTPMYVSSYTDGPVYLTSPNKSVGDKNSSDYIGLVEIPGNNDPPQTEVSSSNSTFPFLFECSNFHSDTAHELSRILDTSDDVHLEGFVAGRVKPTFLQKWQNSFVFRVQIYWDYNNKIRMKIAMNNKKQIRFLEQILLQWFARRDNERQYLANEKLLYENSDDMIWELGKKIEELNMIEKPVVIMRKLSNYIAERKIAEATTGLTNSSDEFHKWQEEMRLHGQLVTSLYARTFVKGAHKIVKIFRHRVNKLRQCPMTPHLYMELIFLYNELFTFRESETLTAALNKAIPGLEQWNWSDQFPHATSGVVEGAPIEYFHGQSITDENRFYVDCEPDLSCREQEIATITVNGTGESSQMLQNLQTIQESDTLAADNVTYNVDDRGAKIQSDKKSSKSVPLKKLKKMMLLNLCNNASKNKTKEDDEQQLLINVSKRRRRKLRSLARRTIESAKTLNSPRLKKMANTLRIKLLKNTAHTNDVMLLWRDTEIELKKSGTIPNVQKGDGKSKIKQREPAAKRTYENSAGIL